MQKFGLFGRKKKMDQNFNIVGYASLSPLIAKSTFDCNFRLVLATLCLILDTLIKNKTLTTPKSITCIFLGFFLYLNNK